MSVTFGLYYPGYGMYMYRNLHIDWSRHIEEGPMCVNQLIRHFSDAARVFSLVVRKEETYKPTGRCDTACCELVDRFFLCYSDTDVPRGINEALL